ncbi:DprA-like winged helix domain-containing protein [Chitinasiproducens palmae]|uniref:DprA-like winged helix domain-containing protein n=1 Tax=Chitinasiproducens palmae TaxID=1770053 RepID=UPI001F16B394|nr:hypothetical protein [Chitinasiproducens palmae]
MPPPVAVGAAASVLAALGHAPTTLDQLLERTQFELSQVNAILLELELAGTVARAPGNVYERITPPTPRA